MSAGQLHINQFFPFAQVDGDESAFPGGFEFADTGPLHIAQVGGHEQELLLVLTDAALYGDHRVDFFVLFQGQQIPDESALGGAAGFRDLVPGW